jgi:hypothetical protein
VNVSRKTPASKVAQEYSKPATAVCVHTPVPSADQDKICVNSLILLALLLCVTLFSAIDLLE